MDSIAVPIIETVPEPDLTQTIEKVEWKNEIIEHLHSKIPAKTIPLTKGKLMSFLNVMNSDEIDIVALKRLSFRGIPDELRQMRGVVWRLLLNFLPSNSNEWVSTINTFKEQYEEFKKELIIKPQAAMVESYK